MLHYISKCMNKFLRLLIEGLGLIYCGSSQRRGGFDIHVLSMTYRHTLSLVFEDGLKDLLVVVVSIVVVVSLCADQSLYNQFYVVTCGRHFD